MKLEALKCPNCGAALNNIDPELDSFYCTYCGYHIVNSNNTKQTIIKRYIDDAEIKKAEAEIKRAEAEAKKATSEAEKDKLGLLLAFLMFIIAMAAFFFFFLL